jgi:hypothetical protein
MEVHHHSHTLRTKWKHYLWEFFMLFLAVFCGYLAERKLEREIEHHREKVYMRSLVEDLAADTVELNRIHILRMAREEKLDRLIAILGKGNVQAYAADVYRLADSSDDYESFLRNDRTIHQLKFSGQMRLLRKPLVSEAIMKYDNFILSEVDWNNRTEAERIDKYKEVRFHLLDAQILNAMSKLDKGTIDTIKTFRIFPADAATLNIVTGSVFQVKRISETCRNSGDMAKMKAIELLELIKNEYDL